ncbi:MAG TPA: 1-(5-phosphoribosyl)-5-[(5-phosphoribosylamino)methylideneamino]imidazole-4-carboxamide isomerase [Dehalococcoidia bacterium]|nr:1-(5-phosphoribosyl)-5-[(5-phosphoribosylamino)methylideneamino]imidazole-4-carboxamide isomerase [Dehalococcoidia bacterium]
MTFEVIPAIDLRGGHCVRLFQGDYARETVYDADPVAVALRWQSLGATRLHVVDLDGARSGEQANADAVRAIVGAVSIPVELGGGVRDLDTVSRWLEAGLDRVYLGTAAVTNPELVSQACARFPGRVAAGADARDGRIAVRGWEVDSGESVLDFARRTLDAGVCALSYTNVSLDGTFAGPDMEGVRRLLEDIGSTEAQIILAGGVGSLEHITAAAAVEGLDAVIVGRALYEGRVDLAEALAAVSRPNR